MPTKKEIRAEAIKRGLIKVGPSQEELRNEAIRRGLISEKQVQQRKIETLPRVDLSQSYRGEPITTLRKPVTPEEIARTEKTYQVAAGIPETALTMGTAAIAEPAAGIAGVAGTVLPGEAGQGARWVEGTKEAMTFDPKSEPAKATAQALGTIFEGIPDISRAAGNFTFDLTGSPLLATAAASTPTLIGELIGLKGLRHLKKGTRLIDDVGAPTKALRKALDKQGLDYDQLSTQAKNMIPKTADPGFLTTVDVKGKAENALVEQIKAGGREDALAGLQVIGDRVKADPLGAEAVKQGFTPGLVQSVKTSNPATKEKMLEMSKMMRQIKKDERLGLDFRPDKVVGESVSERLKYIRDVANKSRDELNDIAKLNLPGKKIDGSGVISTLEDALIDLDVNLEYPKSGGTPKPIYEGSLISKDRSSQKVINDVIELLAEGGEPDALRAHKLKRQLDILIDFKKKSPIGLTDAGKKVLKKVRRSLNDAVRDVSQEYAKVNDRLSTSLNALDDIDTAVGTIDIFGKNSDKAIGTKMRSLMSQQQGRIRLENAVDGINDSASNLGGVFEDDVKDLVMFSNALNKRFGSVAEQSFAGQITQAMEEGSRRVGEGKAGAVQFAIDVAGKGIETARGINDFNAFESIDALLKRP